MRAIKMAPRPAAVGAYARVGEIWAVFCTVPVSPGLWKAHTSRWGCPGVQDSPLPACPGPSRDTFGPGKRSSADY